jgi:hypothetical protein
MNTITINKKLQLQNDLLQFIKSREVKGVAYLTAREIYRVVGCSKFQLCRWRDSAGIAWVQMSRRGTEEDLYSVSLDRATLQQIAELRVAGYSSRTSYGFRNHKIGAGA